METLFGAEMPLAVRFFIAFLIVLGLIGATAWAVRRFGAGRLGHANARGRQPRLAVIDSAPVDGRRRLVLIRRDNVEHLLMIGGPSDIVVEPNIVRAVAAPRDMPAPRPSAPSEALPRAVPLPETGSWPLQPEPASTPRPLPRPLAAAEDTGNWPLQPQVETPPPRIPRDPLAGLADELTSRPTRDHAPLPPREAAPPRAHAAEPRIPAPRPAAAAAPAEPGDESLAEMAHRLEAALRKPSAQAAPDAAPQSRPPRQAEPQPRPARPAEPRAPRAEPKPAPSKTLYDSLEQEMASLLGRPAGKT